MYPRQGINGVHRSYQDSHTRYRPLSVSPSSFHALYYVPLVALVDLLSNARRDVLAPSPVRAGVTAALLAGATVAATGASRARLSNSVLALSVADGGRGAASAAASARSRWIGSVVFPLPFERGAAEVVSRDACSGCSESACVVDRTAGSSRARKSEVSEEKMPSRKR